MLGFSPAAFGVLIFGLAMLTVGGFWALIASDGHPAFLAPIFFALFLIYLVWMVLSSSVLPGRPDKRGNR